MHSVNILTAALALAAGLLSGGCSTVENAHRQKTAMMADYLSGDTPKALAYADYRLTPASELGFWDKADSVVGSGDELMWQLEAGALNFNSGNYAASISRFERAEELIAEYDERARVSARDAAAEGATLITNLNALPYRGFCRDRIALSIFKALAYLGADNEPAFRAQLFRLRDDQKKVQDDYQEFFDAEQQELAEARKNNASAARQAAKTEKSLNSISGNQEFNREMEKTGQAANRAYGNFLNPAALFLSGLGLARDNRWENALIDFTRLYEAMPNSPLCRRYYVTALQKTGRDIPDDLKEVKPFDFPLDRDCVYVLFANGRSAAFRQIAIYFPVMTAWPVCEYYPAPAASLNATADGRTCRTETIADMDAILAQEYQERLPGMIARIVLSTAIKEAGKYAAAYAVSQENEWAGAGVLLAASLYTAAMNTADTRTWEVLPKEFQLTQFPMPEDRLVAIESGGRTEIVKIPAQYRSAIIYVNAPDSRNFSCQVLGMKSK